MQVYVAHYKPGPRASAEVGYTAVCNTQQGARPPGFSCYDDSGGLPKVNESYCELSILRKLQVDRPAETVGLVHYRRLFATNASTGFADSWPGVRTIPRFDWAKPEQWHMSVPELEAATFGLDWCTAAPIDVCGNSAANLLEQFTLFHDKRLLHNLDEKVGECFGTTHRFSEYLSSTRLLRPFNMFLGRIEVLDQYANPLWQLLEAAARTTSVEATGYEKRWPGFVAERIHSFWADVLAPEAQLQVGSLPVILLQNCVVENSRLGQKEILGEKTLRVFLSRARSRLRRL